MAVGKKIFEPDEIRKTIQALKDSGELFEVRCLESNGKRVSSGYFRDTEMMLEQLSKLSTSDSNIYIMLNNIKPECYSREQRDKFITNAKFKPVIMIFADMNGCLLMWTRNVLRECQVRMNS